MLNSKFFPMFLGGHLCHYSSVNSLFTIFNCLFIAFTNFSIWLFTFYLLIYKESLWLKVSFVIYIIYFSNIFVSILFLVFKLKIYCFLIVPLSHY